MKHFLFIFALFFSQTLLAQSNSSEFSLKLENIQNGDEIPVVYKLANQNSQRESVLKKNQTVLSWMKKEAQNKWQNTEFENWFLINEKKLNQYILLTQLFVLESRQSQSLEPIFWGLELTSRMNQKADSLVSVRLANTMRSLLFDEIESQSASYKLNSQKYQAHLERAEKIQLYPDVSRLFESEAQAILRELTQKSVTENYQNYSPWIRATLSANQEPLNVDKIKSEVQFYMTWLNQEIKKSPYTLFSSAILKIKNDRILKMKSELKDSFAFVESLGGVPLTTQTMKAHKTFDKMLDAEQKRIRQAFAQATHPLNNLYLVIVLGHLENLWTQSDVNAYKMAMSRMNLFKTQQALAMYQIQFKKYPQNLEQLVAQKYLKLVPQDYFSGTALKYKPSGQIWSVGENRQDDGGEGDDLRLTLLIDRKL